MEEKREEITLEQFETLVQESWEVLPYTCADAQMIVVNCPAVEIHTFIWKKNEVTGKYRAEVIFWYSTARKNQTVWWNGEEISVNFSYDEALAAFLKIRGMK